MIWKRSSAGSAAASPVAELPRCLRIVEFLVTKNGISCRIM